MTPDRAPGTPRPYSDPYVAGVALGLVLLAAFVVVGRGLGASGAFASVAASAIDSMGPASLRPNDWIRSHLTEGGPTHDWLVIELAGVCAGGWLSAALARRASLTVERGPTTGIAHRLVNASAGGALMGVGAVLARGCTSGQALTGGALMSVGSWLFIAGAFGAAYLAAHMTRGAWR